MSDKEYHGASGAPIVQDDGGGRREDRDADAGTAMVASSAPSKERLAMLARPIRIDYPAARSILECLCRRYVPLGKIR